jgi:hypothetical protein
MAGVHCPGCAALLPKHARVCQVCKTLRSATDNCKACLGPLTKGAKKCTICDSYQGIRRWFDFGSATLSAAAALVSVIALSIGVVSKVAKPISFTKAAIAGSTRDTILIGLVNSGNAASVVRDIAVSAKGSPVLIGLMTPHTEDEAKRLLNGPGSAVLRYNVDSVTFKGNAKNFWTSYGNTPVHLRGTVVESDGTSRELKDDATLNTIRAVIEEKCAPNPCRE